MDQTPQIFALLAHGSPFEMVWDMLREDPAFLYEILPIWLKVILWVGMFSFSFWNVPKIVWLVKRRDDPRRN
jgi:hypothetical protein